MELCSKDTQHVVIIFIDECDALLSSTVVAGMLSTLLDRTCRSRPLVVAATNSVDSVPSSLRRPGRFDIEFSVAPPTGLERLSILVSLIGDSGMSSIPEPETLREAAEEFVGYVAADLVAIVQRAVALAVDAGRDAIDADVLRKAKSDVEASPLRSTHSSVPATQKTRWEDIAGDPGGALVRTVTGYTAARQRSAL